MHTAPQTYFNVRTWFVYGDVPNGISLSYHYGLSREFTAPWLIPVADNDMGDYLVISTRGTDFGAVYFLRIDMYYEEPGALSPLAPSFREFLKTKH